MPVYEYSCEECGERFEKWLRSLSSTEQLCCPRCGSHRVKKAVSLVGRSGLTGRTAGAADSSCAPTGG
ncbi:MAG: zinc ribbon domain-containing protein [Chloroflexi bacterium]|nr:zinc ribbon domain-containing protein [Chloroflexota bacterium]